MTTHTTGDFEVTGWDESTYEELGGDAKLTRASVQQQFTGDLEATGSWQALMCYTLDGRASYTGQVRVVGKLGGRSGSFVLQTDGGYDGSEARWSWSVIPGSATDDLAGLTGSGELRAPHGMTGTYDLDYDLPSAS